MYQSLLREGKGEPRPWRMQAVGPKDSSNLDLRRVLGSRPVGSTTTYCIAPIMAPWLDTLWATFYDKQYFAAIINSIDYISMQGCRIPKICLAR